MKEKKAVLTVVVSQKKTNPVARPVPAAAVEGAEPAHQSPQDLHNTTLPSYQVGSLNLMLQFLIDNVWIQ